MPQRWGRFGMICEANGVIEPARDAYATATSLASDEPKWWYRLALVEARTGRIDEAIDAMRHAIELECRLRARSLAARAVAARPRRH